MILGVLLQIFQSSCEYERISTSQCSW